MDFINNVRKRLFDYLHAIGDSKRIYVFPSQLRKRFTEEGIHRWFRMLKA